VVQKGQGEEISRGNLWGKGGEGGRRRGAKNALVLSLKRLLVSEQPVLIRRTCF